MSLGVLVPLRGIKKRISVFVLKTDGLYESRKNGKELKTNAEQLGLEAT